MRRLVYLLLAVSLVQLSGLTTVCVPCRAQTHPCCPMPGNTRLPNPWSLPSCCLSYILNCQGSITEAGKIHTATEYTAESAAVRIVSAVPSPEINRALPKFVSAPISPPRSPLSQSCLLLI